MTYSPETKFDTMVDKLWSKVSKFLTAANPEVSKMRLLAGEAPLFNKVEYERLVTKWVDALRQLWGDSGTDGELASQRSALLHMLDKQGQPKKRTPTKLKRSAPLDVIDLEEASSSSTSSSSSPLVLAGSSAAKRHRSVSRSALTPTKPLKGKAPTSLSPAPVSPSSMTASESSISAVYEKLVDSLRAELKSVRGQLEQANQRIHQLEDQASTNDAADLRAELMSAQSTIASFDMIKVMYEEQLKTMKELLMRK